MVEQKSALHQGALLVTIVSNPESEIMCLVLQILKVRPVMTQEFLGEVNPNVGNQNAENEPLYCSRN